MTLEEIRKVFEDYEKFKELASQKFVQYMEKQGEKPKFYKATWGSYSFDDIDFDKGFISFVDDDFYHGYDLHDYDYQHMPISEMFK